jgi:hypothetical protein
VCVCVCVCVDAVILGMHGAMVAQGYDDPEGDLLSKIRAMVGPGCFLSSELDPHSHLTDLRFNSADLLIRRVAPNFTVASAHSFSHSNCTPCIWNDQLQGVFTRRLC